MEADRLRNEAKEKAQMKEQAKEEEQKADNIIIEKNEQVQQIKKEVAVKPLFSGVSQFQMMDILAKGASIVQSSGLSAPKKQGF